MTACASSRQAKMTQHADRVSAKGAYFIPQ
jgi:hypothetical protein